MPKIFMISLCIILFAVIITGCFSVFNTSNAVLTPADDKNIIYSGRIDFTNPKAVRFDWPGILISTDFQGPFVGVRINDGNNDYNYFIDGVLSGVLVTKKGIKDYTLASTLSAGRHSLMLSRRGEGYQGIAVFEGFLLSPGAKLAVPCCEPNKRKIEFIGDSISVGYGVEGPGVNCPSEREFKNNWKAFSAVAARTLNAQYHIIAISGRGLVKNWGEKVKHSTEPMPFYYDRTLQNDPSLKWDFKSWIPDVVVINLGTNDYSAQPVPDEDVFVKAYVKLINTVKNNYPGVKIFLCAGPAQMPSFNRYIVQVVDSFQNKDVYRVDMQKMTETELGCDWHPNVAASERIAKELVEQIRPVLKWD